MLEIVTEDPTFIKRIITADKTLVDERTKIRWRFITNYYYKLYWITSLFRSR